MLLGRSVLLSRDKKHQPHIILGRNALLSRNKKHQPACEVKVPETSGSLHYMQLTAYSAENTQPQNKRQNRQNLECRAFKYAPSFASSSASKTRRAGTRCRIRPAGYIVRLCKDSSKPGKCPGS